MRILPLILCLISFNSLAIDIPFKQGDYICSKAFINHNGNKTEVNKPTTLNINKYGLVIDDLMGKDVSEYYSWDKFHKVDQHLLYQLSKTWSIEIHKGKAVINILEFNDHQIIEIVDCSLEIGG